MRAAVAVLVALAACGGDKDARRAGNGSDAVGNTADPEPPQVISQDHDVELQASSHGGVLELTFRNTSKAVVAMFPTHVFGSDVPNYDWLRVTLIAQDGTRRDLTFVSNRDESGVETIDLAAGGDHVVRIDLAMWARRFGPELAQGKYRALVDWDTNREPDRYWHGRLSVSLDVTI